MFIGSPKIWEGFAEKLLRQRRDFGAASPHVTQGPYWGLLDIQDRAGWEGDRWSHGNWTCGFWPGVLWQVYRQVPDPALRVMAEQASARLLGRMDDVNTHDVGFMFMSGVVEAYVSTRQTVWRTVALHVAENLARRRQAAGYLAAWGPLDHPLSAMTSTIDTMMNLPLLWWASRESGNAAWRDVADRHALWACDIYFRDDHSTYHQVVLDPETGHIRRRGTFQGSSDDSCWSRGQAWAMAGFTEAFIATGRAEFKTAATKAIDYFVARLPHEDAVPPWDFSASSSAPKDSSAAAIAAYAFLRLGLATGGRLLIERGVTTVKTLLSDYQRPADAAGFLDHACYSVPQNQGVDEAVIWGDYFLLKALSLVKAWA